MPALPPVARETDPLREQLTVERYVRAFTSLPWADLLSWPPDVFCVCNLLLDHTESYRFVVAPPYGRSWPPAPRWLEDVTDAAARWVDGDLSDLVRRSWAVLLKGRDTPLERLRSGEDWEVCQSLLTLHAAADQACAVLSEAAHERNREFVLKARAMLTQHGSLCRLSPTRVRVVPKTNFAPRGITIRSISRYLALFYESVDVRWRRPNTDPHPPTKQGYRIVLLPWPLRVAARNFRRAAIPSVSVDEGSFGFFEFAPDAALDTGKLAALLLQARITAGTIDAVVLPEGAVLPEEIAALEWVLAEHQVDLLVTGVRSPARGGGLGRNYLHFGVRTASGWERYEQDKHHRWCLDEAQIRQYHLMHHLRASKQWWEAIDIPSRTLHVVDLGNGATVVPLVCEDLARTDEVIDLLRRIGPSIVVAVLLDGPQLTTRWSGRYATVLAEEPGSAVLTLTSIGMAARSRLPGLQRSRAVALWADVDSGPHAIYLGPGAEGILLTTTMLRGPRWTADGRRHDDVARLTLTGTRDLRREPLPPQGRALGSPAPPRRTASRNR